MTFAPVARAARRDHSGLRRNHARGRLRPASRERQRERRPTQRNNQHNVCDATLQHNHDPITTPQISSSNDGADTQQSRPSNATTTSAQVLKSSPMREIGGPCTHRVTCTSAVPRNRAAPGTPRASDQTQQPSAGAAPALATAPADTPQTNNQPTNNTHTDKD